MKWRSVRSKVTTLVLLSDGALSSRRSICLTMQLKGFAVIFSGEDPELMVRVTFFDIVRRSDYLLFRDRGVFTCSQDPRLYGGIVRVLHLANGGEPARTRSYPHFIL